MNTYKIPDDGAPGGAGGGGMKPDLRRTYVARSGSSSRTRIVGAATDAEPGEASADPVSGWLVIVKGPGRGEVLTMGQGVHTLGRGAGNRLVLDFGDDTVSETDHIRLIYDPKAIAFYVVLGTGKNLIEVDGETLLDRIRLKDGSLLVMGATTLRFAPFCSEAFHWNLEQA